MQYMVTTLAALGLAFYTSWNLTLVTLATVPVSALVLSFLASKMQHSIEAQRSELNKASKLANNAISSINVIKYFNGQTFEKNQYRSSIKRAAKWYLRQARSNALQIAFVRVMTLGMFVQGFWYGSSLVSFGRQSAGDVLTTFWACLIATQSIEQILPQMVVLEKGRAAGAALQAVLERVDKGKRVNKMAGRTTPRFCDGDIEVRKVVKLLLNKHALPKSL
jgi:ATP-binding cassette, subfamily B (MDR/TAP), member 1